MDFHIIIPTYNRKILLKRSIDSILNQKTKVNYFIYIIDDWSIDWTKDFLNKNYKKENIFYFYKKNWWVCSARNFWLKEVLKRWNKEDFILFLDSDDELTYNSINEINNIIIKNSEICYFAFWVKNENWIKTFYNKLDNQILNYEDSLSELKAYWEFFRVIKLDILIKNNFLFPEKYNWWEFLFWLEINKKYDLLLSNKIVRIYYQNDIWITRDLLNESKINNFLKVTKLFIDNYWEDLYNLNKKLLWIHYLVYARMLALSWNRLNSIIFWFKWLFYSKDLSRFILYFLSILPYWIKVNNLILKIKK